VIVSALSFVPLPAFPPLGLARAASRPRSTKFSLSETSETKSVAFFNIKQGIHTALDQCHENDEECLVFATEQALAALRHARATKNKTPAPAKRAKSFLRGSDETSNWMKILFSDPLEVVGPRSVSSYYDPLGQLERKRRITRGHAVIDADFSA
jgi:hypothetical protein